jgi:heme-degrading monooxygenase HmoA
MYVVRDVFRCKPGKAKELANRFQQLVPSMERDDHFRNCKVMVDVATTYWTVVLEAEFETLADFERHMAEFSAREEVKAVLAGYMELVDGGHRELYRLVE